MSMNVNPRRKILEKADSTKVVLKGVIPNNNDSIFTVKNNKTHKKAKDVSTQNAEPRKMSRGNGLVRTLLNAATNYFLPQGTPGIGDMLIPTEEEQLEDITNKVNTGKKLTPEEQKLYDKSRMV